MSIKQSINQYLFYEFGLNLESDEDETKVSENWPFDLHITDDPQVYQVIHETDTYYVVTNPSLTFYSTAEMTVADLKTQQLGAHWIRAHDPVNLESVRLGDEHIPTVGERRAAMVALAASGLGSDRQFQIAEGLFLASIKQYFALVQDDQSGESFVIGSMIKAQPVNFPKATAWRRLAHCVGKLLQTGELS